MIVIFILFVSILLYLSRSSTDLIYKFYVVSSDSMSPVLNKGDLVVITPQNDFSVGDVITFKSPIQKGEFITHKIIKENFEDEPFFTTKGDRNNVEDPWRITKDMIVGKVSMSIPFVGYPVFFIKSSPIYFFVLGGFILLICFAEINFLSSEVAYEWESRNRYRFYRKIKRIIGRIDRSLAKFHQHKLEDTGF